MDWRWSTVRVLSISLAVIMLGYPLSTAAVDIVGPQLSWLFDFFWLMSISAVVISTVFSFSVVGMLLQTQGYAQRIQLLGGLVPLAMVLLLLVNFSAEIFLGLIVLIMAIVVLSKTRNTEEAMLKKRLLIHLLSIILLAVLYYAGNTVIDLLRIDNYDIYLGLLYALVDASMIQVLLQVPLVNRFSQPVAYKDLLYVQA